MTVDFSLEIAGERQGSNTVTSVKEISRLSENIFQIAQQLLCYMSKNNLRHIKAEMENSTVAPQKIRNRITIASSNWWC